MTSVFVPCPTCRGAGGAHGVDAWVRCPICDGIGKGWAPGAPGYDSLITLADRDPGEIVVLGNGDRGKILWHMPRKKKKVIPETTFLGLFDEFTDEEHHKPIPYPSCVGVAEILFSRAPLDDKIHDRERDLDYNDPIHRQMAGRLM